MISEEPLLVHWGRGGLCLDSFEQVEEIGEAVGLHVADGDGFEAAGTEGSDVEAGAFWSGGGGLSPGTGVWRRKTETR
ncbi:hypothetical protein [Granulicella sp. S190]|uniref:hypothetical protein n=1 Tax=Granulicella sp. S190 TaxID=1747226 RepID=UPI00131C5704|nr:hypothetical protein [Granulicella sp. S190]